jgi:WD40 repeat protein/serine/threonine protein kinase
MSQPDPTLPQFPPTLSLGNRDLAMEFGGLCSTSETHPDVRDFLRQAGQVSLEQLVAVLCVDMRQRWLRGDHFRVETYLAEYPALGKEREAFLDLVYFEVLIQEQLGRPVDLEEYQRRLPHLFEQLRQQVEFGRSLKQEEERTQETAFPAVPGYEVLQQLGEGAMGVVYRARQRSLGREVALKMVKDVPGSQPQLMERFLREASTIARLKHPHIVQIHEIGQFQGLPYLCLEYIAGGSLADRLKQGPLSPRESAELVRLLARAMHSVHQEGIIHRDLKPGNILLQMTNDQCPMTNDAGARELVIGHSSLVIPKIADFGLARLLDSESELTHTGNILGTPSYMAPEQAEGKIASVGPASDIWALGAILYALLTGRPPFVGKTVMETLERVRHAEPVPPRRLRAGLSRDLETICLKCLDKNPLQRYASAGELADELGRSLAGEPIRARPLGPWTRTFRWARRRPAPAALIVLMIGLATIGFPLVLGLWVTAQRTAESEAKVSKELKSQLYYNKLALAQEMLSLGNVARADELLESLPTELRGWEYDYLKRLRYGASPALSWEGHRLAWVDFSPDDRWIALCDMEGGVQIRTVADGEVVLDLPPAALSPVYLGCRFSPDGKRLALAGLRKSVVRPNRVEEIRSIVRVVEVETGEKLFSVQGPPGLVREVVWGPKGDRLAVGGGDGTVKVWDSDGQELATLTGHSDAVNAVAFSPDGQSLASASSDGTVKLWGLTDFTWDGSPEPSGRLGRAVPREGPAARRERRTLRGHKAGLNCLTFSPDGLRVFASGFEGIIRGWDIRTGAEVVKAHHEGGGLLALVCSPDGQRLAGSGLGTAVQLWDAQTGQVILALRGHGDAIPSLAFSHDGRRLASASWDGTVKIWDARPVEGSKAPGELRTCRDRDIVFALAYTPAGRGLISGNLEGQLKLWDPATGEEQLTWQGHKGPIAAISLSANGERLASIGADGALKLWDLTDRTKPQLLQRPEWSEVRGSDVAFSPDGQLVAAPWGVSGEVKVWETASGKEVQTFPGHRSSCYSVSFAPDGRRLASSGYDQRIKIWDLQTGEKVQDLEGHQHLVIRQVFSPDGKQLASASWDHTVKVWDVETGKDLLTLRHKDRVVSVAFRPDGQMLVTGSFDGAVVLWDARTGKELKTLRGHSGICWFVAFSPDGRSMASASGYRGGGEIKIWELPQNKRNHE